MPRAAGRITPNTYLSAIASAQKWCTRLNVIPRENLKREMLKGRVVQHSVGKAGASKSARMTVGFARYSEESGPMEPHQHAEEVVYVVDAKDGWVRYGPSPDKLGERIQLRRGMTLHTPELEWHVFEYDRGGYVDIVFYYAQVDNIFPATGPKPY